MELLIGLIILLFSAILHEVMHGWVADKLGDPTARLMGRLTLNPLPHIDPFMSIIFPLVLLLTGSPIIFGAAKPVPVNPVNLRDGKKDMALVALAGPLTNIGIAIIAALLLKVFAHTEVLYSLFFEIIKLNLALGILNLIPIPPLDGSKVFTLLLPDELAIQYLSIERFGIFILLVLLAFPIAGFSLSALIDNLLFFSLKLLGIQ